jgi:hypothetical protein
MYNKIEGGETIDIQGLQCNLPPSGYVYNIVTKKLDYVGVYRRAKEDKDCYWEKIPFPSWYSDVMKKWDNYDKVKKDDDDDFYDERLETFKAQEWGRRLNGFWFRNNDKDCYLTGLHYYYLQYWQIDIGSPKFRMPDLEKAYFLDYCVKDPLCMGLVEVTKRRFGKSFWAGAFLTEYITRTKMTNGGIQSKTGSDSKKFFGKTVVNPFRRLPKIFRPIYDNSLGSVPKSELRFQKPNVRGKKSNENISDDELGSVIDWASADGVAYDGQKLQIYICDEVGKTTEVNVYERHEIVRYCLLDDEGQIIGKALYTTTVEKLDSDKDGVQAAFKLLWDASNHLKKGEDGRTVSGLYRFFMTAKKTRNFDPYGYPDEEKTLKAILADRETVKNNPRALAARIRKEPLTIEEAFLSDTDECIFNTINIANRKKELTDNPPYMRKVLFYRDLDGVVGWRDVKNPESDNFHWRVSQFPKKADENKFKRVQGLKTPLRIHDGAIAVDGYSNSQGGQKYGSRASAWIGRRYDILDPLNTGKAIGWLYGRPAVKETLHEQILMAAEFFGYEVAYEHNSDDYLSYFRERGMINYLAKYPISTIDPNKRDEAVRYRGFPTTPFSLTKQVDLGIAYFEHHCNLIDYIELLEDAEKFDPNARTEFDITVSFLMLIVLLQEPVNITRKKEEPIVKIYASAVIS